MLSFLKNRSVNHSLAYLNIAQFLSVVNDNIFKLVIVFFLIDLEGASKAPGILSLVGAIYVIPFILFSSNAGILADRFSKQKIISLIKGTEVIIMVLATVAFAYKISWACYTLLFCLATHSAFFGPSKYGIISELVENDKVSKANGLITSFTYIGIIIGTFFASFLTQITGRNFILIALCCLALAIIGYLATFGIKRTVPQYTEKAINPFFIREIYNTLKFSTQIKHLLTSIIGASFFLFVGAYTQLNIIPFTIESLHRNEVEGGYLFLLTAVGIALGSYLAGKASKGKIQLGISCLAGYGVSLFFVLLALLSQWLTPVMILLILLGTAGGAFTVPFDTFNQMESPKEKRGQIIAAANFLSFVGVLLASIALYFFSVVLELSAATGFFIMGIITLFATAIFTARLSDVAIPFLSRKLIKPFFKIELNNKELIDVPNPIFVLERPSWFNVLILFAIKPNIEFIVPGGASLRSIFYSSHSIPISDHLLEDAQLATRKDMIPCFYTKKPITYPSHSSLIFIKIDRKKMHVTATFSKD